MVCNRCKMAVQEVFDNMEIPTTHVELGEVELENAISTKQKQELQQALQLLGFALIDDKKSRLISRTKTEIVKLVQEKNAALKQNLSDYLHQAVNYDYAALSTLFKQVEGKTIEQYFIEQKIERVKELLVYDELTLSEIAFRLHYSSVAHLSSQFKKLTGLPPSQFKSTHNRKRIPLDEL